MKTEYTTIASNNNNAIRIKSQINMSGTWGRDNICESRVCIEVKNFDERRVMEYWLDQHGSAHSEKALSYQVFDSVCRYIEKHSDEFVGKNLDEIVQAINTYAEDVIGQVYYYTAFVPNYYGQGELEKCKNNELYSNSGSRCRIRLEHLAKEKQSA